MLPRRCLSIFFFFQAEDGIRAVAVTGVQTCALPISGIRPQETACRPRLPVEASVRCAGNPQGVARARAREEIHVQAEALRIAASSPPASGTLRAAPPHVRRHARWHLTRATTEPRPRSTPQECAPPLLI